RAPGAASASSWLSRRPRTTRRPRSPSWTTTGRAWRRGASERRRRAAGDIQARPRPDRRRDPGDRGLSPLLGAGEDRPELADRRRRQLAPAAVDARLGDRPVVRPVAAPREQALEVHARAAPVAPVVVRRR